MEKDSFGNQIINFDIETMLSEEVKEYLWIENVVTHIKNSNLEEILEKIEKNVVNINYAFNLIEHAIKICPLESEKLIKLFSMLSKKHCYIFNKKMHSLTFRALLIHNNIIEGDDNVNDLKPLSEIYEIFDKGSIEYSIKTDNVDAFFKLSGINFDPKRKVKIDVESPLYFVRGSNYVTYMQIMAFFGSVKCFKASIIDGSFDQTDLEYYAVAGGNLEIVHLTEQLGFSFNATLTTAIKYHKYKITEWILRNYNQENLNLANTLLFYNDRAFFTILLNNLFESQSSIDNSLFNASKSGNFPIFKYLVENCNANIAQIDKDKCNSLHYASLYGHMTIVQFIIENFHPNIETVDRCKSTALHYAVEGGNLEIVRYLVENCKANIEVKDSNEFSLLNEAIFENHFDVVKYLIEKCHSKIDDKTDTGSGPLQLSAIVGNVNIAKYLVENCNADIEEKDSFGKTPFYSACEFGKVEVAKFLYEHCNAKINIRSESGFTPLHEASQNASISVVKYLIDVCHANVDDTDNDGNTPLHVAVADDNIDVVKFLVINGKANVNAHNKKGYTPLHCAAQIGHLNVVKFLVEMCHANIWAKDNSKITPFLVASINGHQTVADYLESASFTSEKSICYI